ncbi:MAG: hypothetical protein SV377_02885 [Halobacteria archaeon]|nr:hypothetical protein [Halobacteria archaeon]
MEPEELLSKLIENGIVEENEGWISLTEEFEETLETYRQIVERTSYDELAESSADLIDDVSTEDIKAAFGEHNDDTIARYLAIRAETGFDDETTMLATQVLEELIGQTEEENEEKEGED